MLFLYNIGIQAYYLFVLLASVNNKKARAWIEGRKNLLAHIESKITTERENIWFHFASLGEFEQGRPLLEEIKEKYPAFSIVVTFFSPSGFEVRKNYENADHVFYLPLDTSSNAKEFIALVKPSFAVFTKYEYWYHFFNELHKHEIPLFIISGIFRKDQPFFKWYGGLHRKMLFSVSHFFVQNAESAKLLNDLGLDNVCLAGDTRFDRVIKNIRQVSRIQVVENFCIGSKIFIAGSSWPEDEVLIAELARTFSNWKFIIAPHDVSQTHVRSIEKIFPDSVKWSDLKGRESSAGKQVLIIDNIGMLLNLYQYGDIAYIGGGFGAGIHNIQEAAAFGTPVLFGPNYYKFQEARDLIELEAAFSIKNQGELNERMRYLQNDDIRAELSRIAKVYVASKAGATEIIMEYLGENVLPKL